jgi:hypothetical protein
METPETTNETPTTPKAKNYYQSIDQLILAINTALSNANHPEIAPLLDKRGYKATDIEAAKTLVANLQTLQQKQKKEYGEQYEATEKFNKHWDELHQTYAVHVELARIAFDNDTHNYAQLGLKGQRKTSFSGYIQQARLFYSNGLADKAVLTKLAEKGIAKSEMDGTLALIDNLEKEKYIQTKETGEAQQATKERDAALDKVSEWFGAFKRTAQVALIGKPQLTEILGFKA